MTSQINHRPPAFEGDEDYQPNYKVLLEDERMQLNSLIEDGFLYIEKMLSVYEYPCGFYRASNSSSEWTHFLKVLPDAFWEVEHFAASVEAHLVKSKVAAREFECQRFTYQHNAFFYCRMPFMEFDSLSGSIDEAEKLGIYLREVHQCLNKLPLKDSVKSRWLQNKSLYFNSLQQSFSKEARQVMPVFIEETHLNLINTEKAMLNFDLAQAQVVHSDLNPGNILFNVQPYGASKKDFMLIDYEISFFSYFPKEFDVAMLIQRLFLERFSEEKSYKLMLFFLKGYGQLDYDLISAMKAMSIRSLLILLHRVMSGNTVKKSEWLKFIDLYMGIQKNEKNIRYQLAYSVR